MTGSVLTDLPITAVNAFVYGGMGALAGALVTWLLGRHLLRGPWRELVALWRHHNATQERLADSHEQLVAQLTNPPTHQEEHR